MYRAHCAVIFAIAQLSCFDWGLQIPILGRGGRSLRGRDGTVRKSVGWWVPISLRVSEIGLLPILFSSTPLLLPYPVPHLYSLSKSSPCFPGNGNKWIASFLAVSAKSESVGLIVCAICFQDVVTIHQVSTSQTDGRTDDMRSQDRALH